MPLILDKARDDEQRQILRVHLAGQAFGRPFFAAAGNSRGPQGCAALGLRRHYERPGIRRRGDELRLEASPMAGAEIERLLGEVYALPKDLIDKAKQVMKN